MSQTASTRIKAMRFLLGALLLLALPVHAYFGLIQPWLQSEIRTGYVMTRAQVVSPEGNLFLIVEESSNTSGNPVTREVRLVGEVEIGGDLDGFYVLSAADIRYYQNWYKQLRAERGENLMDRAEWLDRDQLAQGIKLANGTVVSDLRLADVTKKVLVLGERDRFGSNPDGWLLMQVPYDPDQVSNLDENVTSLLFDRDGNRLDQTTGSRNGDTYTVQTFTYRTAYFGQGEEAVEQSDKWRPAGTDKIFGPMTSQTVRLYEPSMPVSSTNERGLYSLFWIMPCPFGGILDFTLELELQARSYNPMGSSLLPLLMHHQTSAACSQTSSFLQGPNFYVDLIWMAGQVRFANELNGTPLPIGEELLFDASAPELTRAEYQFDFDGDGTADTVVQANKKVEDELDPETNEPTGRQFIVPDTEGDPANYQWQAVYFSSGTRDPNAEGPAERQPDLWRVADRNLARDANNELLQAGRLTQISTEAALNTDVYIFRESTGELIVEVSGLPEAGDRRIVDNGRAYTWNTVMRGPRSQMFIGGAVTLGSTYSNQKDPQQFAEDLGISSRFIGRDTGIPGPGETLRIVAINRTTGYTGSATFTLGSPSTGDNVLYSGSINQRVPQLTLTPPNLKVWARRIYDIEHGLTQGEKAEYLIGHEGAATRNDTLVAIFTEWLDEYGKPLPEGLGENSGKDFGLSGRLAKLTGNELTPISAGTAVDPDNFDLESIAQGSAVVEFGIKPGRQAQLIRLKADHVSNEHYYVNVFGRAINKEACPHCEYDQTGKNEGILAQRPNHYTPFYVPRYDEETTLALRKEREEQRRAEAEEQAESGTTPTDEDKLGKVEPQYAWMLRPEYQFSLIELTMNELQAVRYELDENGNEIEVTRNLLDAEQPVITSSDDLVRVLTDLLLPAGDPLEGFDGPTRQYVLALGEDELLLEFDSNGQLQVVDAQGEESEGLELTNIEHLSALSVEDFLTIRLYLNSDPENALWQWAFEYFYLDTQFAGFDSAANGTLYISADDPEVDLQAIIIGYSSRNEEDKKPRTVQWEIEGDGALDRTNETNGETGAFFNRLTLPPAVGAKSLVRATLDDDEGIFSEIRNIEVVAGEPRQVVVQTAGTAHILGHGKIDVSVMVLDQHSNRVSDNTPVDITVSGSAQVPQYASGTVGGNIHASITGAEYAGDIEMTVRVGDVVERYPLTIEPLNIALSGIPSQMESGDAATISVQVTDSSGAAVPDVGVVAGSSFGFVSKDNLVTDAAGHASFTYLAPDRAGDAVVSARVGLSPGDGIEVTIVEPPVDGPSVQTDAMLLVGDQSTSGTLEYEHPDGASLALPYVTSTEVAVKGEAGSAQDVVLGTLFSPNRAPLLALNMNALYAVSSGGQVAPDDTGLFGGIAENIVVDSGAHHGVDRSYRFSGSEILVPNFNDVLPASPGMRLWLNPAIQTGTIVNLAEGLTLSFSGGALKLEVTTMDGVEHVVSDALVENQWYQVAARLRGGVLALDINGTRYERLISGQVSYGSARVLIGRGFEGRMQDFQIYDWDTSPLLVFAEGQEVQSVVLDASGAASLTVHSAGNLNAQAGAQNPMQSVDIRVGQYARSISMMSSAAYVDIAGQYLLTAGASQIGALMHADGPLYASLDLLIEPAHASVLDGLPDWISNTIEWVVPIRDFEMLFEQIAYLAAGDDRFDPVEMTLAGLGVLTAIPIAKPLKVVLKPLQTFYRRFGSKPIVKATAGVLDRYAGYIRKGEFDRLYNMLPYLLIVAELVREPEALEFMVDSIGSTDDLLTWIDYFNLPLDGWDGDGEPPQVDMALYDTTAPFFGLMDQAYAAGAKKPRLSGAKAAKWIKDAKKAIGKDFASDPQMLTKGLKASSQALRSGAPSAIKKAAHSSAFISMVVTAGRTGQKRVKDFVLGHTDARIPPLLFMTIVSYLGIQCNSADGKLYGREKLCAKIYKKMALIGKDVVLSNRELSEEDPVNANKETGVTGVVISSGGHGEMFHLAMIAYYLLAGKNIKDIEASRSVWFYDKTKTEVIDIESVENKPLHKYQRRVDIVLGDADEKDEDAPERWVELKSLRAKDSQRREPEVGGMERWSASSSKAGRGKQSSTYNKQYVVDREAAAFFAFTWKNDAVFAGRTRVEVAGFEWWFQRFKVGFKRGAKTETHYSVDPGKASSAGRAAYKLTQLPASQSADMKKYLLGGESNSSYRKELVPGANGYIGEARLSELVLSRLANDLEDVAGEQDGLETIRKLLAEMEE